MGLTPRKDGWYVQFPVVDDGKVLMWGRGIPGAKLKRWKTHTTNKTMAKQQEAMIKTDLMKGVVKSERIQGPGTLKALAGIYINAPEIKRQSGYRWKAATLQKKILPFFGDKRLAVFTHRLFEDYREYRRAQPGLEGTSLKPASVNRDLSLLKHLFSYAVREGWLDKNPVSRVKLDKEDNARDRVLDPEEFERLQVHSAPHLQTINLVAYQTAMRLGEILGLMWDRVDFKSAVIRLRGEDTKTKEGRIIPLAPALTKKLKDLYIVRYLHEPHVFLLDGKSVGSTKTAFKNACRRAEIRGFRFHDFRHTAITNMRRAGIDHLTIMRITGHKTLSVFKRYNSFLEGDLRQASNQFNTYLTLAHQGDLTVSPKSLINQSIAGVAQW